MAQRSNALPTSGTESGFDSGLVACMFHPCNKTTPYELREVRTRIIARQVHPDHATFSQLVEGLEMLGAVPARPVAVYQVSDAAFRSHAPEPQPAPPSRCPLVHNGCALLVLFPATHPVSEYLESLSACQV